MQPELLFGDEVIAKCRVVTVHHQLRQSHVPPHGLDELLGTCHQSGVEKVALFKRIQEQAVQVPERTENQHVVVRAMLKRKFTDLFKIKRGLVGKTGREKPIKHIVFQRMVHEVIAHGPELTPIRTFIRQVVQHTKTSRNAQSGFFGVTNLEQLHPGARDHL